MRTIELKLYSFAELSPEAQEKAINDYRHEGIETQYYWDEAYESVKVFHKIFPTHEGHNSWLDVRTGHIDNDILELKGLRLRTYLINNFGDQIYTPKYLKHGELRPNEPTKGHRMMRYRKITSGPNAGLFLISYYSSLRKSKDCPLTGVCYDMDLLDVFYKFIDNYREFPSADHQTFEGLIKEAFYNLRKSLESEDEYRYSDEGIREELENQDYEYTEDGERY